MNPILEIDGELIDIKDLKNLTGIRNDKLFIKEKIDSNCEFDRYRCVCDCGNEIEKFGFELRLVYMQSCGCTKIDYDWDDTYGMPIEYSEFDENTICGMDENGSEFYFDKEDFIKIVPHRWIVTINKLGETLYATASIEGKRICMHSLLLGFPKSDVDHKDKNKTNNRKENLRLATDRQNSANKRLGKNNKSGVTGVRWVIKNNRWISTLCIDKKFKLCKHFKTFYEAVKARLQAEKEFFGEFAPQQHLYKQYGIE